MSQFIEMFGNPVTNTKGWKTAKIKDVAPEMPSKEQLSGKIWLLNLDMIESNTGRIIEKVYEDVENALSVQSFDEGNVLFSKLRPYLNKVVIPDEPGMATTELVPLRPEPSKLHKVFLSHLLRGNQFVNYANDIAGGTKMPRMPLTELRNFDCILPPMDKQLEFVFIAEQVDKSKFGDFKSQFIEIFYGMETTPVKDYIDDSFPGEWGTEDKDGNGVKVIRTTNFTNSGKLNLADVVTRSIEDRKVVRKQIKKYDTILERSGGTADNPVGRVVLFEEDNLFLCNNFTQVLRFKDVDPRFAFYALYYFYQTNRTAIRSMGSKTTGIQNLNMSKYLEIGIPNASDEDQKAFVTIAEQADKSKSVIQKALVYLNDIQSDELGKIA
ncbi:restriction endonuclease subunit S [Parabacteroides sp. Y3-G-102]|jgi:type I restriction enzyme S subunit|uniref:restriction endonuclease subunit S n=1 Tax=Bacteroidales TaxID=171549 RepID=UPI00202EE294|nr:MULTISPECIES: restriction endonuclease subunit S [Bacteroidales]MCM0228560.1 restriction endonuclease subunit S [Bacteroides fragilis]MCM0729673.1 restriction endonuclease subunit S [Parabacteroides sp. Y3-G-102]